MTDKNIYEIISSTLNVQVSMFKNDIEEKKKKNNFFFINDYWIVGYVYGYCQTSYNLQKEKSIINFPSSSSNRDVGLARPFFLEAGAILLSNSVFALILNTIIPPD